MIYQLMYYSTARVEQTDGQLLEILKVSRANNERCGITGLLLYGEGVFFQVLEGTEENVKARYARIQSDERHQTILVAAEREVPERSFGSWAMGYAPLDRELQAGVDALIQFRRAGNPTSQAECDPLVNTLIKSFMRNQRLT